MSAEEAMDRFNAAHLRYERCGLLVALRLRALQVRLRELGRPHTPLGIADAAELAPSRKVESP